MLGEAQQGWRRKVENPLLVRNTCLSFKTRRARFEPGRERRSLLSGFQRRQKRSEFIIFFFFSPAIEGKSHRNPEYSKRTADTEKDRPGTYVGPFPLASLEAQSKKGLDQREARVRFT